MNRAPSIANLDVDDLRALRDRIDVKLRHDLAADATDTTTQRRAADERAQIRGDVLGILRRLQTDRRTPWCCETCGCLNGPTEHRCFVCNPMPPARFAAPEES